MQTLGTNVKQPTVKISFVVCCLCKLSYEIINWTNAINLTMQGSKQVWRRWFSKPFACQLYWCCIDDTLSLREQIWSRSCVPDRLRVLTVSASVLTLSAAEKHSAPSHGDARGWKPACGWRAACVTRGASPVPVTHTLKTSIGCQHANTHSDAEQRKQHDGTLEDKKKLCTVAVLPARTRGL